MVVVLGSVTYMLCVADLLMYVFCVCVSMCCNHSCMCCNHSNLEHSLLQPVITLSTFSMSVPFVNGSADQL